MISFIYINKIYWGSLLISLFLVNNKWNKVTRIDLFTGNDIAEKLVEAGVVQKCGDSAANSHPKDEPAAPVSELKRWEKFTIGMLF